LLDVNISGGFELENDIRNRKEVNNRGNESEKEKS
jgi:hypothetical protein